MVKFIGCARRKAGTSVAEFQDYWKNNHGPLVKSVPEFWQYVRQICPGSYAQRFRAGLPAVGL